MDAEHPDEQPEDPDEGLEPAPDWSEPPPDWLEVAADWPELAAARSLEGTHDERDPNLFREHADLAHPAEPARASMPRRPSAHSLAAQFVPPVLALIVIAAIALLLIGRPGSSDDDRRQTVPRGERDRPPGAANRRPRSKVASRPIPDTRHPATPPEVQAGRRRKHAERRARTRRPAPPARSDKRLPHPSTAPASAEPPPAASAPPAPRQYPYPASDEFGFER